MSWKYSRLRDITSKTPGDLKAAEAEDALEPFREVKIDEEEEGEGGESEADSARPKTATTTAGPEKRRRRTKSAKGSYAGRGGAAQKTVEPIVEASQENVEANDVNDATQTNDAASEVSAGGSKKIDEETTPGEEEFTEKKVELENENMEEYLERMARLISRMVADHMGE